MTPDPLLQGLAHPLHFFHVSSRSCRLYDEPMILLQVNRERRDGSFSVCSDALISFEPAPTRHTEISLAQHPHYLFRARSSFRSYTWTNASGVRRPSSIGMRYTNMMSTDSVCWIWVTLTLRSGVTTSCFCLYTGLSLHGRFGELPDSLGPSHIHLVGNAFP